MRDDVRDILAGTLSGVAQIISGHPIDTVKVRLQAEGSSRHFSGTVDCFRKTLRYEGVRGLYKGAAAPLWGAIAQNAAIFYTFGAAYRVVAGARDRPVARGSRSHLYDVALASAASGFSLAFIESPVELVKCKVQAQFERAGSRGGYPGSIAAAQQLVSRYGASALGQGFAATALRSTQAKVFYFTTYEATVVALAPGVARAQEPLHVCAVAGGLAGAMAWCALYPTDMLKTRLQLDHPDPAKRRYQGIWHCLRTTVRQEGVGALYVGFQACLLRAVVVNSAVFTAFTAAQRVMRQSDEGDSDRPQ